MSQYAAQFWDVDTKFKDQVRNGQDCVFDDNLILLFQTLISGLNHDELWSVQKADPTEMFFDMPAMNDLPSTFENRVHDFGIVIHKLIADEHIIDSVVNESIDG